MTIEMHRTTSPWFDISATVDRPGIAIADVHGRADLLEAMIAKILEDTPEGAEVVYLGDLIDRGPENLRALDMARAGIPGRETIWLAGNHEEMLICATRTSNPAALGVLVLWARNGGYMVLDELGLDGTSTPHDLVEALGDERLLFLNGMENFHRNGQVLFVHGGIHPMRPIAEQLEVPFDFLFEMQDEDDSIRWVRGPWVGHDRPLEDGTYVIYGHTIQRPALPCVTICQSGIDLGAYGRSLLCAAEVSPGSKIRYHFVGEFDRIQSIKQFYADVA